MATKGQPFEFSVSLFSQATGEVLLSPTIQAADFEISTDGGSYASLTNTPTVTPASSGLVAFDLTASEVGNEKFSIKMIDSVGSQWETMFYHETVTSSSGGDSAASIYSYFTNGSNEDAFKADLSSLTGTGARSIQITVTDPSVAAIQSATVRVSNATTAFATSTSAAGLASFSLDDDTWTVSITKAGYSFTPVSLVVADNVTIGYQMQQEAVPSAAAPGTTNAYFYAYDESGPVANIAVEATIEEIPSGSGTVFIPTVNTGVTSATGLFQFPVYKGGEYKIRLRSIEYEVTIPSNAADPYPLGNLKAGK